MTVIFTKPPNDSSALDEQGYTIVENIVALALLVAVLLPTGVFLGNITLLSTPAETSLALNIAQESMDTTLASRRFVSESWQTEDHMWRVERTIGYTRALTSIDITVFRGRSERMVVRLSSLTHEP